MLVRGEDEKILRDIMIVLEPLKTVTVIMQGEKYVTLPAVYPFLCDMLSELNDFSENKDLHKCAQKFASGLAIEMQERTNSAFLRPASLISSALDPRFKRLRLIDPTSRKVHVYTAYTCRDIHTHIHNRIYHNIIYHNRT